MIKYILSFCFIFIISSSAWAAPRYMFTPLGALPNFDGSLADDINNSRQVVGQSFLSDGRGVAFLWQAGVMTSLGTLPGGESSAAFAINEKGEIAGFSDIATGESHAFIYKSGEMLDIGGLPGSSFNEAFGINDAGQVVGVSGLGLATAFFYENGAMSILSESLRNSISFAVDINELGQVVGFFDDPDDTCICAFIYEDGVVTVLPTPGSNFAEASGINDLGQVVGSVSLADGRHAALWQSGIMIDLGILPGFDSSSALDINNNGQIVGGSSAFDQNIDHAFFFDDGSMYDLNDLAVDLDDWVLIRANAINDHGDIVGTAFNEASGVFNAFLLTPLTTDVPEPAAFTLLGLGMAGVFAIRRRQKHQVCP